MSKDQRLSNEALLAAERSQVSGPASGRPTDGPALPDAHLFRFFSPFSMPVIQDSHPFLWRIIRQRNPLIT